MTLTPVPESVMVSGEFVALPATFTLPVTLPVAEGLNVAVNVAVCPALNISPVGTPLAEKPAPDRVTPEIVTVEVPALVSVTVWLLLLDTFTLPKLNADELELRIRVPEVIVRVAGLLVTLPALLLTVTLNVAPVVADGVM